MTEGSADRDTEGKLLDWVEAAALENIKAHISSSDDITRESNAALTVLIAAAGATLAYAVGAIEKDPINFSGAVIGMVLSTYLFALCAVLVWKCLKIGVFPPTTNEPKNLYQKNYTLNKLREVELRNLQQRIEMAALSTIGEPCG